MISDKFTSYCREHRQEFRDELRDEASQALTSWPGKTAAVLLALSSVMTYLTRSESNNPYAIHTLFTYIVPILIIFLYPIASLIASRIEKFSQIILDFAALSVLIGFCLTLKFVVAPGLALEDQSSNSLTPSGQINFVLLMTTAFAYHTTYKVTLMRNICFTGIMIALIYFIDSQYLASNVMQVIQGFMAGTIFSWLFFARVQTRFYYKSTDADTRQHLYRQLSKLVYPHQLEMIKSGDELENTMPVEKGLAIINVFDVQRSSEIRHEKTKSFYLDVFRAFSQICMHGYQHNPLKSRAFRLKETGDGFISSIGYPFLSDDSESLADHSIDTALIMFKAFNEEVKHFGYTRPIKGVMGLAYNSVQGTFQSSGIKSYDLFGEALIQAYRYEEIRKDPVVQQIMRGRAHELGLEHYNLLIIQEVVYNSLKPEYKTMFSSIDLKSISMQIRQDIHAQFVYYHVLP